MRENWNYRRGDLYLVDLGENTGSEQGGCRPVVVLQNDVGNRFAPTLVVAAVTSRSRKKKEQPTHAPIEDIRNLSCPSVVLAEQLQTVDKSRVLKYIGKVPQEQMRAVDRALLVSLALDAPRTAEA